MKGTPEMMTRQRNLWLTDHPGHTVEDFDRVSRPGGNRREHRAYLEWLNTARVMRIVGLAPMSERGRMLFERAKQEPKPRRRPGKRSKQEARQRRREQLAQPESLPYLDSMKEHDALIYAGKIKADDEYLDRFGARLAHERGFDLELVQDKTGQLSFRKIPIYKH
jgi:hypothetical protein